MHVITLSDNFQNVLYALRSAQDTHCSGIRKIPEIKKKFDLKIF